MAVRRVQLRRGTTAQNDAFTGVEGEITVDTQTKSIRVHDAGTAGGLDLMRADMSNQSFAASDLTIADGVGANTLTIGAGGTTVRIPGALTVVGTTTNTNNLLVQDKAIVLADGSEGSVNSTDSIGMIFTRTLAGGGGAQDPAILFWKEDGDTFILGTASVTESDAEWSGDGDFAYANLSMASLTATGLSLSDNNITNVGDIALDTISADGTTITINATDNTQSSFVVKTSGGEEYINVDGRNANMALTLGVVASTTTIQSNTIALGTDAANNVAITVAERSGDNAGQSLTISAGSSDAGANDNNGGDLVLASGGGDGTGTSSIQFKTKVSGTDASAERMRIHTDGTVGIGTATPSSLLHISGADTSTITLENTTGDNGQDDDPSTIQFIGNGQAKALAQIVGAHDGAADDDKGVLIFKPNNDSDPTEALRLDSALKATFAGAVEIASTLDLTDGNINNVATLYLDDIQCADDVNVFTISAKDNTEDALIVKDTGGLEYINVDARNASPILTLAQATSLSSTLTVASTSNLDGGIAVDTDKFTVDGGGTGNTATKGTLTVSGNTVVGVAGEGSPNLSVVNNTDTTTFSVTGLTGATTIAGTSSIAGIATFKDSLAIQSEPANDLGIQFNSDRGNDNISGTDYDVKVIDVYKGTGNATQGTILWDDSASSFSVTTGKLHSETQFTVGPIAAPNLTVGPTTGAVTMVGTDAYLTLRNNEDENQAGEAETQIQFQDHDSKNLAVVKASHEGTANDYKGQLLFYTNDGDDNDNGQLALTISSAQLATFAGNVTVSGNTLTFGNGATIVNGGANLLTITEATVAFSADVQVGGNITADASEAKTIFNNVTNAQITIGSADTANTDTVLVRQLVVVDDIDVSGAGALTVGATVGANNLTLGGATTTTVTAGDLTVNGGTNTAVLTLGQDQAQNSEITVAARTGANAGQSLTISAGSTAQGANDLNGGDLLLKSGSGDGDGTSDIEFWTLTTNAETTTQKMTLKGSGNLGIGDTAPGTMLQVSGADAYLTLKNTTAENGEGEAETKIIFEDHGNNALAQIEVSHHGTADDEKGKLILSVNDDNGLQTALTIDSSKLATFAGDVTVTGDFIVQGDTTTLNVGTLDVEDTVIRLNKGQASSVNSNDIGFFFERGVDGNNDPVGDGIFYWDEGTDFFKLGTTTDAHSATDFHANTTLGGLQLASLELPDDTASALNITEGNNSYLKFVTTDDSEVIEFGKVFTAQSGSKIGNLTLESTVISGGADAALTIKAETNLIFQADSDNDGGVNNIFSFLNGAGTEIAQINETGDLQIDGDLTVSGNDIDFPAGATTIGASVGGSNLTLGGATTTTVTAGALTVNGATATIKGAEAGVATLSLLADEGDDNGDGWKLVATDHATRTLTMSGQNTGDANYTAILTLTSHDTATSTNASFAGSVTVANGLDLTDSAITNVTDIALDSITADDANTITINLAQAGGGTALTIKDDDGAGVNTLLSVDATNDASKVSIATNTFETSATTSVSLLGAVVINEGGLDKDFRVEGTGRANALVVDGTNGNVGIGVAEAGTMLQIEGANAYLTLKNSTAENGNAGAETKIIFEDHGNNALGQIEVNHQDGADDEFGRMIFSTNNDSGLQTALTIDKDQLATFVGDISIEGAEATAANLYIKADEGDDAGDEWRVQANTNDTFSIGNDKNVAGTYVSILTLTGNATATSTNATFAGEVTISGTGTNALDFSANDITIGNSIAGNTLTLGASNSTVAVAGDLTVGGGDATITAGEGASASLVLKADEGDDAGDEWRVLANTSDQLILGNDKNVAGTYAPLLTLTGNATATSTNASFAGNVTINGVGTNALDFTNANTTIGNSIGNAILTLGASNSTVAVAGDLTVSGGDATITGIEGGSVTLNLVADEGDDNGDAWKVVVADSATRTLTISGQRTDAASYRDILTLTAHDTATSSLATFGGDITVSGGTINLTNGSVIDSSTGGTLLLTEDIVKTSGDLQVGGDDIKNANGDPVITFVGAGVSTTLTATTTIASGDLQVNGNITGDADEAKTIFAATTTEGNLITLGGGGTVVTGGKLRINENIIENEDGETCITLDNNQKVTLAGDLIVTGVIQGNSGVAGSTLIKDFVVMVGYENNRDDTDLGVVGEYTDTNLADYLMGMIYEPSSVAGGKNGAFKLFHGRTNVTEPNLTYAVPDADLATVDMNTVRGGSALGADNTAGTTLTISGGASTGSATGGAIEFKTGGAGAGASVENAQTLAMTIENTQQVTIDSGNLEITKTTGKTVTEDVNASTFTANEKSFQVTVTTANAVADDAHSADYIVSSNTVNATSVILATCQDKNIEVYAHTINAGADTFKFTFVNRTGDELGAEATLVVNFVIL